MIRQLKRRQHATWSIELNSLSPQTLLILLTDINECQVREVSIHNTHFDSNCVSQLVEIVTCNKTIEELHLLSSPLVPDTYKFLTTAITANKIIKGFCLWSDNNITDKDIPYFCHLITNSNTLQRLSLTLCPNITEFGKQQLKDVLVKNNTLKSLWINSNRLRYCY